MLKLKTTKSKIKSGYTKIISIGYCNAQYLLSNKSPFAYSAGVNGWACDYYDVNGVCISTGYSPIGNITPDYEAVKRFEDRACELRHNRTNDWDTNMQEIDKLLLEFIEEVTKKA